MKRDNFSRAIIFTLNITTHRNQFFFLSFPSPSLSLSLFCHDGKVEVHRTVDRIEQYSRFVPPPTVIVF